MEKRKVIVYVDGYNFYYGLKHGGSKWKRLLIHGDSPWVPCFKSKGWGWVEDKM